MLLDYVIVFVGDMDRSVAFYRDLVGLPLKFVSPEWSEFASQGATFALHHAVQAVSNGSENTPKAAGRCIPGFQTPDLDAFHRRMLDNQVRCVQPPTTTFGVRIAQYVDPDGLVLSVAETASSK